MTLRQILKRVQTITEAHKQVRSFRIGLVSDLFADQTAKYMAACLQYVSGSVSTSTKRLTVNFRFFILDLEHVSQDAKTNEDDVLSDTVSVMLDLIAEFNNPALNDWRISTDNNLQVIQEGENDIVAGWYTDISISALFTQNICQVPTALIDLTPINPTDSDMTVFDLEYIADGTEGTTLSIPSLVGKKILLITRENGILYKVSNDPDTVEYTWDNSEINLGLETIDKARFLILYRNY